MNHIDILKKLYRVQDECLEHETWNLEDEANWRAMANTLQDVIDYLYDTACFKKCDQRDENLN
jgi:hypothetical protein